MGLMFKVVARGRWSDRISVRRGDQFVGVMDWYRDSYRFYSLPNRGLSVSELHEIESRMDDEARVVRQRRKQG